MVLFFDIDGTLIDQQRAELAAAREFLSAYGAKLPRRYTPVEFCQRWRELRAWHLPAFLGGEISYADYHRCRIRGLFETNGALGAPEADARFAAFYEPYRDAWRLFDDVLPALAALRGVPLAILSNGHGPQQRLKLERTGIAERFDLIVIADEIGAAKPGPEIFRRAAAQAACAPQACVHVGDQIHADAHAAQRAGFQGVWLNRARCASAPGALPSLRELPEWLARNSPAAVARSDGAERR